LGATEATRRCDPKQIAEPLNVHCGMREANFPDCQVRDRSAMTSRNRAARHLTDFTTAMRVDRRPARQAAGVALSLDGAKSRQPA